MFNEELYKKLEDRFGIEKMIIFSEIMAVRHDLLFTDSDEPLNEEDFERDWWLNKFTELSSIRKEKPTVDDIIAFLLGKGYSNISQIKPRNDFEDEDCGI